MSSRKLTDKVQVKAVMDELLGFFEDDNLYIDERLMILDAVDLFNSDCDDSRVIHGMYARSRNKYDLFRESVKPSNKRSRKQCS